MHHQANVNLSPMQGLTGTVETEMISLTKHADQASVVETKRAGWLARLLLLPSPTSTAQLI